MGRASLFGKTMQTGYNAFITIAGKKYQLDGIFDRESISQVRKNINRCIEGKSATTQINVIGGRTVIVGNQILSAAIVEFEPKREFCRAVAPITRPARSE
jgi:hypothetical protein